jgi:hypothetical protein
VPFYISTLNMKSSTAFRTVYRMNMLIFWACQVLFFKSVSWPVSPSLKLIIYRYLFSFFEELWHLLLMKVSKNLIKELETFTILQNKFLFVCLLYKLVMPENIRLSLYIRTSNLHWLQVKYLPVLRPLKPTLFSLQPR